MKRLILAVALLLLLVAPASAQIYGGYGTPMYGGYGHVRQQGHFTPYRTWYWQTYWVDINGRPRMIWVRQPYYYYY